MSLARIDPDIDVFEGGSISQGFDTHNIFSDMTLVMGRMVLAGGVIVQTVQHADMDNVEDFVTHPASPSDYLGGNSMIVRLGRSETKRFVRIATQCFGDDPRFVAYSLLEWP